jgi:hypothetical protein
LLFIFILFNLPLKFLQPYKLKMAKYTNINTGEVLDRLKHSLNFKSDTDLAIYLGISQPLISAWRARNSMDIDIIITKCCNIDLNWLLLGHNNNNTLSNDNEIALLKNEIEELKSKIRDLKDVIVDLNIEKNHKKGEFAGWIKHEGVNAVIAK